MKIIISESQAKKLIEKVSADVVKNIGAIVYSDHEDELSQKNAVKIPLSKLFKNQPEDQKKEEKRYQKQVENIKKKLKKDKKFTPLIVAKEGKKYRIVDGHHRYDAYLELGKKTIDCIVIPEKNVKFRYLTKKMEKEFKK